MIDIFCSRLPCLLHCGRLKLAIARGVDSFDRERLIAKFETKIAGEESIQVTTDWRACVDVGSAAIRVERMDRIEADFCFAMQRLDADYGQCKRRFDFLNRNR